MEVDLKYMKKILPEKIAPQGVAEKFFHIYLKDQCLVANVPEEEFMGKWTELQGMVGLMKTDYVEEDLSYELVEKTPIGYDEASY